MDVKGVIVLANLMARHREHLAITAENDPNPRIRWATVKARALQASSSVQNPVPTLLKNRQEISE